MRINVPNSNCPRCSGTGKVFAVEKEPRNGTHYSTVFRCNCNVGLQLPYNWPIWESKWLNTYSVDFDSFSGKQLEL